ncbi:hypothetical protein B0H11DRAFT_592678 [Mycena galericulata]|nr:hypothetical protein B0H11DRAFT_592678 [Mycena galericulata]
MTRFTRGALPTGRFVSAPLLSTNPLLPAATPRDRYRMSTPCARRRIPLLSASWLVYFLPAEFAFDGDAVRVPVGKARIVACKTAYCQRSGGENIMKALFEMLDARAASLGCAFMVTAGIPGYYRTHGYEYAINMG